MKNDKYYIYKTLILFITVSVLSGSIKDVFKDKVKICLGYNIIQYNEFSGGGAWTFYQKKYCFYICVVYDVFTCAHLCSHKRGSKVISTRRQYGKFNVCSYKFNNANTYIMFQVQLPRFYIIT